MDEKPTADPTTLSDKDLIRLKGLVQRAGLVAVVKGVWFWTDYLKDRAEEENEPHYSERLASAATGLAEVYRRLVC
jgi:hypothetical protein